MSELSRAVEEELEVLSSIYGDDFVRLTGHSFTVSLPHSLLPVLVSATLPSTYPATSPPVLALSGSPSLSSADGATVQSIVQRLWREAAGDVCCYQTVEALRGFVDAQRAAVVGATAATAAAAAQPSRAAALEEEHDKEEEESDRTISHYSDDDEQGFADSSSEHWQHSKQQQHPQCNNSSSLPSSQPSTTAPFVSGPPHTDRKSVFIAHTAPLHTAADLARLQHYLHSHPKLSRATHNITAYRLSSATMATATTAAVGAGGGSAAYAEEGCDDDGEERAGGRLLHLLRAMGCVNVWVCVSRWYGGVKLGSDRFRIINNVARQLLEEQGYGDRKVAAGGGATGGSGLGGRKGGKR